MVMQMRSECDLMKKVISESKIAACESKKAAERKRDREGVNCHEQILECSGSRAGALCTG